MCKGDRKLHKSKNMKLIRLIVLMVLIMERPGDIRKLVIFILIILGVIIHVNADCLNKTSR